MLDPARTRSAALISATRPCEPSDAIDFFASAATATDDGDYRALWLRPETGEALVAVGAAQVFEASGGADRFRAISRAWRDLLGDAQISGPPPRLLGGFSFDPLRESTALWRGFPAARFVLPERMLTIANGRTWLTTNRCAIGSSERAELPTRPAPLPVARETWIRLVDGIVRQLHDSASPLQKVVVARAEQQPLVSPDVPSVLRRLGGAYPTCTLFAFQHGDAAFVGATPERLVALHGGIASTVALAGSTRRGASPEEDARLGAALLADPKERAEHGYVVNALREAMTADGVCSRIMADAEPRVRRLPNVQHLFTPIRGQVAPGRGVLDLVARLHPTPAVGGLPRQPALELLRERECLDRGWYAGALGWLDANGEGEFAVGIRSALLRDEQATLFAGCGIVAGSRGEAEYAESEWKLAPMRTALRA
jgi:isochorismate synthase